MRRKRAVQCHCDCSYAWGCEYATWPYPSSQQYPESLPALSAPGSLTRDHRSLWSPCCLRVRVLDTLSLERPHSSASLRLLLSHFLHPCALFASFSDHFPLCNLFLSFSLLLSSLNSPKAQQRHLFFLLLFLIFSEILCSFNSKRMCKVL